MRLLRVQVVRVYFLFGGTLGGGSLLGGTLLFGVSGAPLSILGGESGNGKGAGGTIGEAGNGGFTEDCANASRGGVF